MKRFIRTNALLCLLVAAGCQQTTAPSHQAGPGSATGQNAERQAAPQPSTESATDDVAADRADQPNDPGMTTAHDKTVRQEQPSGDESSRAAPNEGDAEPPQ